MEKITRLSLEKHAGPYATWPGSSRLYADGEDTQKAIPGHEIEAQYRCDYGYLVITSYDCPYEEIYEFLLLDHTFKIVAKKILGIFTPLLNCHWPLSDSAIRIHYYDHTFHTLSIEPSSVAFSHRPELDLKPYEDISADPKTLASRDVLQKRLEDLDAYLAVQKPATN